MTAATTLEPVVAVSERPRRPRWWFESLVLVWLLWLYDAVSSLAPVRRGAAVAHARSIWSLEHHLHIAFEKGLNHWLAGHLTLGLWMSDYYDNAHFIVTIGVVGWLWWRHPDHYRPLRTALVLINVVSFGIYWLYPVAPPRLVPGGHIIDIVALTHAFGSWHSGTLASVSDADQLGAMPSVHLAWALWSAWAIWRVVGRHRGTVVVFLYPVLTAVAVVTTGNHFVIDVLAGVAVMVVTTVAVNWTISHTLLLSTSVRLRGSLSGLLHRPSRAGSGRSGDRLHPTTARPSATDRPRT